jgi:hypothetical protein
MTLGLVDEDEEVQEVTDRHYWEKRGSQKTVAMADDLLAVLKKLEPQLELKYNKFYVGLAKNGIPSNFVVFRPQKSFLRVEPRLQKSPETQEKLEAAGIEVLEYDDRWGRYRLRLLPGDESKHRDVIREIFTEAYEESSR